MTEDDLPADKAVARDELHDWLQAHAEQLGPWQEDVDDLPVHDQKFLDGWVLMAYWVDANGEGFTVRIPSKKLPAYQRAGLLHEGLYGFDD